MANPTYAELLPGATYDDSANTLTFTAVPETWDDPREALAGIMEQTRAAIAALGTPPTTYGMTFTQGNTSASQLQQTYALRVTRAISPGTIPVEP